MLRHQRPGQHKAFLPVKFGNVRRDPIEIAQGLHIDRQKLIAQWLQFSRVKHRHADNFKPRYHDFDTRHFLGNIHAGRFGNKQLQFRGDLDLGLQFFARLLPGAKARHIGLRQRLGQRHGRQQNCAGQGKNQEAEN